MSLTMWAVLTIGAPLLTFLAFLVGLGRARGLCVAVSLASAALACAGTWFLAMAMPADGFEHTMVWAATSDFAIHLGVRLTGLTTAMGIVVGTIHLLVQIYSIGYMAHDPGKARYFAFLSLFASAMLSVVYAADLIHTFVAWELVGLSSYLLIGFWSHKPKAAQAAKKAFIMTRFGDVGLLLGLVLLLLNSSSEGGAPKTLLISGILDAVNSGAFNGELIGGFDKVSVIGLLLLCGIVGKSAQFPLHSWLPDAMEGPTPVSSLLHSATMVAAGVYLFALLQPLFLASSITSTTALAIASLTAVMSAGVAMVNPDMKRVLAWSSISQLSFMLMGLAAGSPVAGFFHLVTHAGFKCLLFLTAGLLIHRAHSGDLAVIGRTVGNSFPAATLGLVVGAASLAGVPVLAGFMSKEVILGQLHHHGHEGFYALALLGSAMTAYYATRMAALILRPGSGKGNEGHDEAAPAGHDEHHDDDPLPEQIMAGVVVALALITLGLGWVGPTLAAHLGLPAATVAIHWASQGVALAMAALVLGAGLAWYDYGRAGAQRDGFLSGLPAIEDMLKEGWYIDRFWRWVSDQVIAGLTAVALFIDRKAIDSSVDGLATGTRMGGSRAATLQSGRLQLYLSVTLALLAAALVLLGWK
jgi:NADH-quinone oxidoreductase subunit L